ncbi:MAG: hypothetical protein ABI054_02085 [Planctomycetota bacterium]
MRTKIHAGIAAVALTFAFALPTIATTPAGSAVAALPGGSAPELGSIVNHTFSTPPMNSGGLKDLTELRGRPVLIEYWGTR